MDEFPDLHFYPEYAVEMAVNSVLHYLHECEIEGEEQKRRHSFRM